MILLTMAPEFDNRSVFAQLWWGGQVFVTNSKTGGERVALGVET